MTKSSKKETTGSGNSETDAEKQLPDEGDTLIHSEEKTWVHSQEELAEESSEENTSPRLMVFSGPLSGHVFLLELEDGGTFIVGRDPESQLVLDDGSVSRGHVEIRKEEHLHYISDLGSSNGTLVDGQLIYKSHVLRNESEIKIGVYTFVFLDPNLKDSDLPPTLPIPYEKPHQFVEKNFRSLTKAEETPASRGLIWSYLLFGALALVLLIFGVRTISNEENFQWSTAWTDLFSTEKGPKLAYPLLEVKTSPISGEIFFQDEFMGKSPIEKRLEDGVMPRQGFELRADFLLKTLDEKVMVSETIRFERDQEISSHYLTAPIGGIHIKKMPRNAQLILEYLRADLPEDSEATIKQIKVNPKEPIDVPFGAFKLEIRKEEKFRYRRFFDITETNLLQTFDINDKDLEYTPISITTNPAGANIFLDGVDLNMQTPLKDFHLEMGKHHILLKKENYKDRVLDELPDPVQINEPLTFTIDLPISEVGKLILRAKKELDLESWKQSERTLKEALKTQPQPTAMEKAEIQLLLGKTYFKSGKLKQSKIYFYKSMRFQDKDGKKPFLNAGKIGMARVKMKEGKEREAQKLAVEVFFAVKEEENRLIKTEAQQVYDKISPVKSTIYVDTVPAGAEIWLNGKKVEALNSKGKKVSALTPTIIPDLPVGSFNILLSKKGYEDYQHKMRLEVNDLKPLKVKLRPR